MSRIIYDDLLAEIKALYKNHPALEAFAQLPDDLAPQQVTPHQRDASRRLQQDSGLQSQHHAGLQEALITASEHMHWREVYRPDEAQPDTLSYAFMNDLGVYAIIGETAPFASEKMSLYLVYMPAGMIYPWHYHPAEELYFILSGIGTFCRAGHQDEQVHEGSIIIHETNQPHMMQTTNSPLLALAVWRNHLDIAPTLMARP